MLKEVKIRKGNFNDLTEIQQLFVETIFSICSKDYDSQKIEAWTSSVKNKTRWNEILTDQFVLVVEKKSKIVGFASLNKGSFIDLLYVHKDYQRQGIAYELYTHIEKKAKELGQTELTADVSITARPFFEKVGFNVIETKSAHINGMQLTNYKMTKIIE